ncbi:Putative EF-hand domain pair protein [Septoria linicola]|uniref:Calmodulin n=1 Tax=Septoria linicola TaxID=215465 RepID=A0A9Q9APN8_9PEZI|nr:putative EF-hand domain pair protein [Septoria linicola]USW49933.1 Putative EF-hand domain pair protein [Septoria linicola]
MPPKRKAAAASSSAPKQPSKRRSKLAKENDITAEEEAEIEEAFALFCSTSDSDTPTIRTIDLRRCLIALNAPPADNEALQELIDIADGEEEGAIDYEHFLPVAALQLNRAKNERDEEQQNEEVEKAYALFTRGQDREITIGDLKRVAKELREDVPDSVLRDMVREAKGGGLGGVGKEEFEGVMRRAGVFG